MRKQNLPLQKLMSQDSFAEVAAQLRYDDVSALYAAVGEGHVSTQSVLEKVVALVQRRRRRATEPDLPDPGAVARRCRGSDSGVLVRGAPDILVKLAKCCTPVPGDEIVGFVTRGAGVSVHQANCHNVQSLHARARAHDRRRVGADAPRASSSCRSRSRRSTGPGLLTDVTRVLSEHHVNILSATVSTSTDRLALSRFVFEMGDTDAPRPRAERGAAHRRRLRRLPRQRRLSRAAGSAERVAASLERRRQRRSARCGMRRPLVEPLDAPAASGRGRWQRGHDARSSASSQARRCAQQIDQRCARGVVHRAAAEHDDVVVGEHAPRGASRAAAIAAMRAVRAARRTVRARAACQRAVHPRGRAAAR